MKLCAIFVLILGIVVSSTLSAQKDSLRLCNQYLDEAQQYLLKSSYLDAENAAFAGWELSQQIGDEVTMSRACLLLSECERHLNKDAEAYDFAIRGRFIAENVSQVNLLACHLSLLRVLEKMEMWEAILDFDSRFNFKGVISFGDQAEILFLRNEAQIGKGHYQAAFISYKEFEEKHLTELAGNAEVNQKLLAKLVESGVQSSNWKIAEKDCDRLLKGYYNKVEKSKRIRWNGWRAEILQHNKEFIAAIDYYNKSLQLCSNSDDLLRLPLLINIARCYYQMGNLIQTQQVLDQALDLSEQLGNNYYQALCNVFYSAISNQKGWLNYSIEYAQLALNFAEKANDWEIHQQMHELLAQYQALNGKAELAAYHQQEAKKVKSEKENAKSIEELRVSERMSKLNSKEYWIKSDVEGQRDRKRMAEVKIMRTQQEKQLAEIENRKRMDDIQRDLLMSETQREKERADAELLRASQLNIIQELELKRREQENESLILENEANKRELELRSSEAERARLAAEDQEKTRKIEEQNKERTSIIIAAIVLLVILMFLLFFLYSLRKKNQIIKSQNEQIQLVNQTLNEKNHEIVSGIEYASKFQSIVFPTEADLKRHIEGAFILHRPLEIVSGDLPFVLKDNDYLYVAAVDCIGHGVAASMLSIMTYFNLSEIIRSKNFNSCSEILGELHRRLEVRSNEVKVAENNFLVSIDIALIRINVTTCEIQFAGANLPLIVQTKRGTELVKGNVFSIGENSTNRKLVYTDYEQTLEKGDRLFIFSDGFFHQFGGLEQKQKLSKKRTCEWIANHSHLSVVDMKQKMNELFEEWKGAAVQTDDVVFIGLEI